jgi:tRNA(Ile)-lysidine synthase
VANPADISDNLVAAVADAIDSRRLIPNSARVVVGVSGGCDSIALLAVLKELADRPGLGYQLVVAHLNHCLRQDADQDAEFVRHQADMLGLPCHIGKRDVAKLADELGQGIEQAGRQARYEFLRQVAIDAQAGIVAVAHHADDNVETILYRIIRGTHLHGLSGMAFARPIQSGVTLVRPMLNIRRSMIEDFCQARKLAFRTDASNTDVKFRRNFIRHDLLSLLRERLNPQADQAILRLAKAAEITDDYVSTQAAAAIKAAELGRTDDEIVLSAKAMSALHPAVAMTAIRLTLEQLGVPMRPIGMEQINDVLTMLRVRGPACLNLPGRCTVSLAGDRLVLGRAIAGNESDDSDAFAEVDETILQCPGLTELPDGTRITIETRSFDLSVSADAEEFRRHCQPGQASGGQRGQTARLELLDADKVSLPLICRPRRQGDTFWPLGCSGRQSVSDFLTNMKLSPDQRQLAYWPKCICDQRGIVCLAPLRIDHRAKVTAGTRKVIRLHIVM